MHRHLDRGLVAIERRDQFAPDADQRHHRQAATGARRQPAQDLRLAAGAQEAVGLPGGGRFAALGLGNALHDLSAATQQIENLVVQHIDVVPQVGQARNMVAHGDADLPKNAA